MVRTSTAAILLVVLALSSAACVQVRNMVADRDLVCRDTPDDVCIRVADLGLSRLDVAEYEREAGPIPTVEVYQVRCTADEFIADVPNATRCWMVDATNQNGGIGTGIYELPDGSLR
jgi:hypothetical protein